MTNTMDKPTDITLERTGLAPLKFIGTKLAEVCGRTVNAPAARDNSDWWTITVYALPVFPEQATTPGYIVHIHYQNDHRGRELHHHFAEWTDEPAESLAAYNPLAVLRGFPPGEQYAERQQALERSSRTQYDMLVSAVLAQFPEQLDTSAIPLAQAKALAAKLRQVLAEIPAADQGDREALSDALSDLDQLDACLNDIGHDDEDDK
jgi:hypothetical protein